MFKKFVFLLLFLLISIPAAGQNKSHIPDALMLRYPDVSKTEITFIYAGDIWVAPKTGGMARRLSSAEGNESFPKFSPDGSQIAFTANYDGNRDLYITGSLGGSPYRVTHHSASDNMVDWYPDGKSLLYRTAMTSPSGRYSRLYKISVNGGLPEKLPMEYGDFASLNSDASKIVYQPSNREFATWKRYRGGMASQLWIYDLKNNKSEKITEFAGADALPMWHGNTIYFLSDRDDNKKLNIWAYDTGTKKFTQVTKFDEYDVKWPSLGPEEIVFENGGKLYLLDLANGKSKAVEISIPSELLQSRPANKNVAGNIEGYNLSPKANRALFEARGDIYTVPKEHGSTRNLTRTSGVAERNPVWSPDGKYIAYLSDKTGEYEIYLREPGLTGKEKQLTSGGEAYRYNLKWSPDSKKIAFSDKAGKIYIADAESGSITDVDKNDFYFFTDFDWSPDSRWFAYQKHETFSVRSIFIYDTKEEKIHRVTDNYYNDSQPVFDPDGKYLYFYSNRTFRPVYSDYQGTWVYPNATYIYALVLDSGEKSPFAPRSDEVEIKEEKKEDKEKDAEETEKKEEEDDDAVVIDFNDMEKRIVQLGSDGGNVGNMEAVSGKVLYIINPVSGERTSGPSGTLKYYDLEEREAKTIMSGISNFTVSPDGKNVLYRAGGTFGVIGISAGKKVGDGKLDLGGLQTVVDLKQEWKQIFREGWRVERDYFYDPGMHGIDWDKMYDRYSKLLPYVNSRSDLTYIMGEMIAELSVSHAYIGGGDQERAATINVGLLGCDYKIKDGYFIFSKIYEGAPWDYHDTRSPLREPGIDVKEGEYLIAVNGRKPDIKKDPWAAFQGLAGEVVTLTINDKPSSDGAREIMVEPMRSEASLRNMAWVEHNRAKVEKATNGRCGYIYVPNTGVNGQTELLRQFMAQYTKDALIIDDRFNAGGQIPDRFIELLNRQIHSYWARRDFYNYRTPFVAHTGPKVMLMNEWAGSGGDAFPYFFRQAGLGKLVGKRTWGGLVGISGNPGFIDGGFITAPTFGFWTPDGKWDVENHGVDPDPGCDIDNMPHLLAKDIDQQLDKAIEIIKDELSKNPPPKPQKPDYPDKSK